MFARKSLIWIALVILFSTLLTGCYWNESLDSNEMGVKLDGGRIESCVGPGGVYSEGGWFTELTNVSLDTVKVQVEDPEVVTSDNQLVGVLITVQAHRNADCASLTNLLTNWANLRNDDLLRDTIASTTKESIKTGVRGFTLSGLLDDRNSLATNIMTALQQDAEKYGVSITNVTIENIDINDAYAEVLNQKALITAELEKAIRQQDLINQNADNAQLEQDRRTTVLKQQVLAEQAETAVQVEIARRQGEVVAAANQVYSDNPQAFELKRLEMLQAIFGNKSVFYFVQPGVDLTLLLTQYGNNAVPVPVTP